MEHQFRRFVKRMVGRKIQYQSLCGCGWRGPISSTESMARAAYLMHSDPPGDERPDLIRKAELLFTGQEP